MTEQKKSFEEQNDEANDGGFINEFRLLLKENKKWWITPIIVCLLFFGALINSRWQLRRTLHLHAFLDSCLSGDNADYLKKPVTFIGFWLIPRVTPTYSWTNLTNYNCAALPLHYWTTC